METNMPQSILDKIDNSRSGWEEVPNVRPFCDGMNIEKGYANIGDAKLYYEREGKNGNVPLVLIPGGPGETHQGFHPAFSKAADFAQVIYYDPRGVGKSTKEPGENGCFSVEQAVDDLEKLRIELRYEKWCVLGHSFGGVVARLYAEKYPQHTLGIVLNCAAFDGLPIKAESSKERTFSYLVGGENGKRLEINAAKDTMDPAKWLYNKITNGDWKLQNFYETSKEDAARLALEYAKVSKEFFNDMEKSIDALIHSKPKNNRLSDQRVLILEGKYDVTWAEGKGKKLADCFDNHELIEFNSSHSPHNDEPNRLFDALKNYVRPLKKDYAKPLNKSRDGLPSPPSSNQDEESQPQTEEGMFRGNASKRGSKNYRSVLSKGPPTTVEKTTTTTGNKASTNQLTKQFSVRTPRFDFSP